MCRNAGSGFSLIELMIVLAILALIVAIAVPVQLNALNRSKQAQTMANMRAIATAWEQRAADQKQYNAAGANYTIPSVSVTGTNLVRLLAPTYIRSVPVKDGWGNALQFRLDQRVGAKTAAKEYAIRSPGRNRVYDRTRRYPIGPVKGFDCDIVFANGTFIAWPEGRQR